MKNNIITLDCLETYPKKLLDYLATLNPQEEFPEVDHNMVEYLKSFNTYIYHCTKLKNKDDILNRGIKRIAFSQQIKNEYISLLKEISYDNYDFEKWINEYNYLPGRGTTIHTAGTLSYIKEDQWCLDFFKYFGGEILIEIIKDNLHKIIKNDEEVKNKVNKYREKLSEIGSPYLVRLLVPIKELDCFSDYRYFFGQMCRFYKNYSSKFKGHYIPNIGIVYHRDILPSEINHIFNVRINDKISNSNETNYISIY